MYVGYRVLDAVFAKSPTYTDSLKLNNKYFQVPHNEATVIIGLFVSFLFIKKNPLGENAEKFTRQKRILNIRNNGDTNYKTVSTSEL
jgi:hypothetical protein